MSSIPRQSDTPTSTIPRLRRPVLQSATIPRLGAPRNTTDHRPKGVGKRRGKLTDPVQQALAVRGERLAVSGLVQGPRDEDHENPLGRVFGRAVVDADKGH